MTLCPIALAVGCQKCPAFKVCPLKGVIGDQAPAAPPSAAAKPAAKKAGSAKSVKPKAGASKKR